MKTSLEKLLLTHSDKPELIELLKTYHTAQQGSSLEPSAEFRSTSKERLLQKISVIEPAVTKSKTARPIEQKQKFSLRRMRMTWLAIFITAFVLAVGGTTAAGASEALPGDVLYPVKTGYQQLQLQISDDEGDVELLLEFMDDNIDEIDELMQEGRLDDIEQGLNQYNQNLSDLQETQNRISYDTQQPEDALTLRIQDQLQTQTQIMQQLCDQTQEEPIQLQLQQAIHNAENAADNNAGNGPDMTNTPGPTEDPTDETKGNSTKEPQNKNGKSEETDQPEVTPQQGPNEDPGNENGGGDPQGTGESQGPGEPGSGDSGNGGQGQKGGGK